MRRRSPGRIGRASSETTERVTDSPAEQGLEADSPRCGVRGSPRIPTSFVRPVRRVRVARTERLERYGRRSATVVACTFRVSDRSPVRRTARRLALRSGGVAVSRPCAVTAAARRRRPSGRGRRSGKVPWSAVGQPAEQSVTRSESPASTRAQACVRVGEWREREPTSVHSRAGLAGGSPPDSSPSSRGRRSRECRVVRRVHPRCSGERQEGSGPQ